MELGWFRLRKRKEAEGRVRPVPGWGFGTRTRERCKDLGRLQLALCPTSLGPAALTTVGLSS